MKVPTNPEHPLKASSFKDSSIEGKERDPLKPEQPLNAENSIETTFSGTTKEP